MTDNEIRDHLIEIAKDHCNNDFEDGLPSGVVMFVDLGIKFFKNGLSGKSSESLGDYSVTYNISEDLLPKDMMALLRPYRRLRGAR